MNKQNEEYPLVTFWVTSVGREYVIDCVDSIVEHCKYPNYKIAIPELLLKPIVQRIC